MPELLSADTIEQELSTVAGWSYGDDALTRTWVRKGFNGAMQLANVVAYVANDMNHHPDILVHEYKKVTITTTTHVAGGVTVHDFALARRLNDILGD